MAPILSAARFGFSRDDGPELGPLDLSIRAGDVVTLMGPSGIGKSTLLMCLLGFRESGLRVRGHRTAGDRDLGDGEVPTGSVLIPQGFPFNPNWEVRAFLLHLAASAARGLTRREVSGVVDQVLRDLDLDHRARATVATLSGGEVQRAGIAQVLVLRAVARVTGREGLLRLVAGDELASNLDPGLGQWVLDEIRSIVRDSHCGALLCLHDVQGALRASSIIHFLWPSWVTPTPWVLTQQSPWWRTDALHSLMCLARWVVDTGIEPSLAQLVGLLRDVDQLSKSTYGPSHQILVKGGGAPVPMEPSCARAVLSLCDFGAHARFVPVRTLVDGKWVLGVAWRTTDGGASVSLCVAETSQTRESGG